jgi:hypothetical protein
MAESLDTARIDDCVLALLWLGLHDEVRAWKSFDWDAMDRLYEKDFIQNPKGKAKSVVLTSEGLRRAEKLFNEMFVRRSSP